jgi:hypothetical protein
MNSFLGLCSFAAPQAKALITKKAKERNLGSLLGSFVFPGITARPRASKEF